MGKSAHLWQYHPRSDRHSKIACWGILVDLLAHCALLVKQVENGEVVFGINHEMRDFKQNRKKNLDLVLCTPGRPTSTRPRTLADLAARYRIELDRQDRQFLNELPTIHEGPVGVVQCALEAKACMTEHMKARPRLYDELNSSHQTIHGSGEMLIAVGFVMINLSDDFYSPTRGGKELSAHHQPEATLRVVEKLEELPRRAKVDQEEFDAMAIAVVDCRNDGRTPVRLVETPPAPPPGDIFHYDSMIRRLAQLYEARFPRE